MAKTISDVVIVGGGIAGVATAYYQAKSGVRSVVVEREAIASHASGFAYGGLSPLGGAGIPGPMFPLSLKSFDLHMELSASLPDESGIDFEFRMRPSLGLAFSEDEESHIKSGLDWQGQHPGFSAEWMDVSGLRAVDARISPAAIGGGMVEGMAEVEPYKFVLALAQAAEKMGARVRHGVVTGLKRSGSRVTGVTLKNGDIEADAVVLALGPWSGGCSDWVGVPIEVGPLKGQIIRLKAPGPPLECSIGWSHNYATTKPDGLLWAGTTEERAGFDVAPTAEARDEIMSVVLKMMPSLEDAQFVRQTACLRPLSSDGLVVLGPVPGWEDLYIATGAGRKGILYGPGVGSVTAGLVLGRDVELDISPFDPGRFAAKGDTGEDAEADSAFLPGA